MKKIFFLLLFITACGSLFAQDNGVPAAYTLKEPSDYARYEKNVLTCIDWLMATPDNTAPDKRKQAGAFLIEWMNGSPDVSISIAPEIVTFAKPNSQLLLIFMAGWTKYALSSRKFEDAYNGNLNGLESVISYYRKNKDYLQKDEHVEELIKLQQKNRLADLVKNNMQ